jgi:hypothetical protein
MSITVPDNGVVTNDNTDWVARVRRLEEEVAGLRRALRSRGLIEQAKGILAQAGGTSPEQAFQQLSQRSQKRNVSVADLAAEVVTDVGKPSLKPGSRGGGGSVFAKQLRRAAGAASASVSLPELAEWLWLEGLQEAGASCVAIAAVLEGEAHLVAAAGDPAARSRATALFADPEQLLYPLETANRPAMLLFAFDNPKQLASTQRSALDTLAEAVAGIAQRMWCPPAVAWDQLQWLRDVLTALFGQGKLLSPVRGPAGDIVDFTVEYATREVSDLFGRSAADITGARLLDLEPHLAGNGVFAAYIDAYENREPYERPASYETVLFRGRPRRLLLRRRAVRAGDHLLVAQQHLDAAQRQNEHVSRMEVLGSLGFAEWDLASGEITWSPGFYRLFGREAAAGPSSLDRLGKLADDPAVLQKVVKQLRAGEGAADITIQVTHPDGQPRLLRMLAEAKATSDGTVHLVQAVASDITAEHAASETLRRTEAALADQRMRAAAEREMTRQMREIWYPASTLDVSTNGLRVQGQHWVPPEDRRIQADFLDASTTTAGDMLLAIGDIIGSGLIAAATMTRLMYPARVMARTGARPAEILDALNVDLLHDQRSPLASMVIARYLAGSRTMVWAQAGHIAPVLLRDGVATQLPPPKGVLLGLGPGVVFESARVELVPGDLMIFFTDGITSGHRSEQDPIGPLLREMEKHARDGGPGSLLAQFMGSADGEACVLIAQAT